MSEEPRPAARARDQLTARQMEVMALLAAGKTNFEIADALGLSLEGAKYHVSEIVAKLDVESREEAVAVWSGVRTERWPRARRWALVAACLVAGAVGLSVLIALLADDEKPPAGAPGTWVAWADDQQDGPDDQSFLHILTGSPLSEVKVLDHRLYRGPNWSPDGERLAVYAFANGDARARLVVFERATWKPRREVEVSNLGVIAWSPDSKLLGHFGRGEITIYDRDLRVRKVIRDLPSAPRRPIGGLLMWAPGSDRFAAAFEGNLLVVTVGGDVSVVELPHEDFATGGSFLGGWGRAFIYWEDENSFTAIGPPLGGNVSVGEYRRWTFRKVGNTWKSVSSEAGPGFPESTSPGDTEPGGGFYQGTSADGALLVFADIRFNGEELTTRVWTSDPSVGFQVVDAGGAIAGLGVWFDIVVVRE